MPKDEELMVDFEKMFKGTEFDNKLDEFIAKKMSDGVDLDSVLEKALKNYS